MLRIETVRNATVKALEAAGKLYGVDLSKTHITFDLKGRAAGQAIKHANGLLQIRFNAPMINSNGYDHVLNDTVPHEVAHLVNFANPRTGHNHDAGWVSVCRALGGTGERYHSQEVVYAKGKTYEYTTSENKTVRISEVRHRKIMKGAVYITSKGRVSCNSKFRVVGQSGRFINTDAGALMAAQEQTPTAKKTVTTKAKTASKAEQVREQLRAGIDPSIVIEWAVATLGMTQGLAKTYVKNNVGK